MEHFYEFCSVRFCLDAEQAMHMDAMESVSPTALDKFTELLDGS